MTGERIHDRCDHHVVPAQSPAPRDRDRCQNCQERDGDEAEQGNLLDPALVLEPRRRPGILDRRRVSQDRGVNLVGVYSGGRRHGSRHGYALRWEVTYASVTYAKVGSLALSGDSMTDITVHYPCQNPAQAGRSPVGLLAGPA